MAISYGTDLIVYHDCDVAWSGATKMTTFVRQGVACNGVRVSNTVSAIIQSPNVSANLNGKNIYIQIRVNSKLRTKAEGGIRVCARDSNGGQAMWFVGGSDTHSGGWECFAVSANRPSDITYATPYNPSLTRNIGVCFYTAETSSSINCFQDFVHVGTSVSINASGTDVAGMEYLYNWCNSNAYGIITKQNDVYVIKGHVCFNGEQGVDKGKFFFPNLQPFYQDVTYQNVNMHLEEASFLANEPCYRISLKNARVDIVNCYFDNLINLYNDISSTLNIERSCFRDCQSQLYQISDTCSIRNTAIINCNPIFYNVNSGVKFHDVISRCQLLNSPIHYYISSGGEIDQTINDLIFTHGINSYDISVVNQSNPYQQLTLNIYKTRYTDFNVVSQNIPSDKINIIDLIDSTQGVALNTLHIKNQNPNAVFDVFIMDTSSDEIFAEFYNVTGQVFQEYSPFVNRDAQIYIYSLNQKFKNFITNLSGGVIRLEFEDEEDYVYYNP